MLLSRVSADHLRANPQHAQARQSLLGEQLIQWTKIPAGQTVSSPIVTQN